MKWQHKIPVLRPLIFWLIGTLVGIFCLADIPVRIPLGVALFSLLLFLIWHFISKLKKIPELAGLWVSLFFLSGGLCWTLMQEEKHHDGHFSNVVSNAGHLIVKVQKPPEERRNSYLITGRVQGVLNDDKAVKTHGRLLIYLEKSSRVANIRYGDILIVKNNLRKLKPPGDPEAFDFSRYQYFRRVYHSLYASSDDWIHTEMQEGHSVWEKVFALRYWLLKWQESAIRDDNRLVVANALLTGYRANMNDEVRDAYIAAGAMHILAVSGLHTGLIFIVLHFMLKPLDRIHYGRIIKTISLVAGLWLYACLTGLSPSVCRAATMFSFVAIGMNAGRITNVFQSIILSAFLLLTINPYFINYAGFQLSYSAVAGIVLLVKYMPDLPFFRNFITEKAWTIICVSVAAQLFTMPLSLMYFGNFPTWFIVTNLVALPLASVILYGGMAYFAAMFIAPDSLGYILGIGLDYALSFLNYWIFLVEAQPASPLKGLFIELWQALGMYLAMVLLFTASLIRNNKFIVASMVVLMTSVGGAVYSIHSEKNTNRLIVHEATGETAIQLLSKNQSTIIGIEPEYGTIPDRYRFSLNPVLQKAGVPEENIQWVYNDNYQLISGNALFINLPFGYFRGVKFALIDDSFTFEKGKKHPSTDLVILAGDPDIEIREIADALNANKFIIDSSNKPADRRAWREKCKKFGIPFHDVGEEGAFVLKTNR